MQIIRGFYNIKSEFISGSAVTIGNFDGVHLGHQAILIELTKQAKKLNIPSVVVLFEPQPLEYFLKEKSPARLTNLRNKLYYLAKFKIDKVICVPFNSKFSQLTSTCFIQEYLVNKLNLKYLIIGDDFKFGNNRDGNFANLANFSESYNFKIQNYADFCIEKIRISSTKIREALEQGNFELATSMLGRPYSIMGKVIHGNKIGRTIGFPTANVALHKTKSPIYGVFVATIEINNKTYNGIANIGFRPTINCAIQLLEVNIFDFDQDIYGKNIFVTFKARVRNEVKFESFAALQLQIKKDVLCAQEYFNNIY